PCGLRLDRFLRLPARQQTARADRQSPISPSAAPPAFGAACRSPLSMDTKKATNKQTTAAIASARQIPPIKRIFLITSRLSPSDRRPFGQPSTGLHLVASF